MNKSSVLIVEDEAIIAYDLANKIHLLCSFRHQRHGEFSPGGQAGGHAPAGR
jgi:hypothetical protein